MNPTLLDIAILFSFVPVWAGLCWLMRTGQIHERDADDSVRHDARHYAETYSDKGGYYDENHNG